MYLKENIFPPSIFALEYESSEYSCSSLHLQTNSAYLLVAENTRKKNYNSPSPLRETLVNPFWPMGHDLKSAVKCFW